jgi:hypothetical protein
MLKEDATPGQGDRDPQKEGSASQGQDSFADLSRLAIGTACEVLGGIASGSAEAFQAVNSQMSAPKPNLVEGILQGNARFLERMSHTMDAVAKNFRSRHATVPDPKDPNV